MQDTEVFTYIYTYCKLRTHLETVVFSVLKLIKLKISHLNFNALTFLNCGNHNDKRLNDKLSVQIIVVLFLCLFNTT